ncbi:CotH kinase family protein [bacterium]|nr:CotH kinase family protein [bacterium]
MSGTSFTSNDYFGVYTFMERIESDDNRLDISGLDPWENSVEERTGGYIFKNDRPDPGEPTFPVSGFTRALVHVDPDGDQITPTQKAYITTYSNQLTSALRDPNGINPTTGLHYSDYLDVDSFIDNFWLNILAMDPDWGRLSQFFYKDRNERINGGPIWDYDRTMGSRDSRDNDPLRWEANTSDTSFTWFDREYEWFGLHFGFTTADDQVRNMSNPQLRTGRPDVFQKIIDRWYELRSDRFSQGNMEALIEIMSDQITEAQERNFTRWSALTPGSGGNFGPSFAEPGTTGWDREISHLKG